MDDKFLCYICAAYYCQIYSLDNYQICVGCLKKAIYLKKLPTDKDLPNKNELVGEALVLKIEALMNENEELRNALRIQSIDVSEMESQTVPKKRSKKLWVIAGTISTAALIVGGVVLLV